MHFYPQNLLQTLPVMLYGMLGIFLVLIIIAVCVKILARLFPDKNQPEQKK